VAELGGCGVSLDDTWLPIVRRQAVAPEFPPERDDDWKVDAACRGMDPELFFTERGESTADAKAVCRSCPVRAECLDYALAHVERFGVWGAMSERERRRIRGQRRRGAA
jgi:WhiB family redox-sensing transcriptional regulator